MIEKLKEDAKDSVEIEKQYNALLDINKNNTKSELESLTNLLNEEYDSIMGDWESLKIKNMIDTKLAKLDTESALDVVVEDFFDSRIHKNIRKFATEEELETVFNTELREDFWRTVDKFINLEKDKEIQEVLKNYRFEIKNLHTGVLKSRIEEDNPSQLNGPATLRPFADWATDVKFDVSSYNTKDDYIDSYQQRGRYTSVDDIYNIYSDKKMKKVMKDIFDEEDLKKRHFGINLSK